MKASKKSLKINVVNAVSIFKEELKEDTEKKARY